MFASTPTKAFLTRLSPPLTGRSVILAEISKSVPKSILTTTTTASYTSQSQQQQQQYRFMSMYNPIKFDEIDPDKIFDEIDVSGSGTITRDEFKAAVSRLKYNDLLKIHNAAQANLKAIDDKLHKINEIEQDMKEIKELSEKKRDLYYNNIGFTTASDVNELFDQAKMKRRNIKSNIGQIKEKLGHTRDTYHNIGLTTAADLDALFPDDDDKKKAA